MYLFAYADKVFMKICHWKSKYKAHTFGTYYRVLCVDFDVGNVGNSASNPGY
jgi:hypothetical protein